VPETLKQRTRRLLQEHGLRASKRLGQHFLVDEGVARAIVAAAELRAGDNVLEIGAGLGALTEHLARQARRVVAVELDRGIAAALTALAGDWSVEVLHEDFLKLDLPALCAERGAARWKVVGNLPYNVTTPILHRLREHSDRFERSVVTVQAEVAERLRARPGSRTYGAVTVAMQAHFVIEPVRRVAPQAFFPEPDVASEVICLRPRCHRLVAPADWGVFEDTVRAAFAQRRKTILNSLIGSGRLAASRAKMTEALDAAGIDPRRRAESLELEEFVALAKALGKLGTGTDFSTRSRNCTQRAWVSPIPSPLCETVPSEKSVPVPSFPSRFRAHAKLNLGLRILGRRPDGYHEIRTVLQSISLHDAIMLSVGGDAVRVLCDDPAVPQGEANTCYRAARAFLERAGIGEGVTVRIVKRIPAGAGLGGASADAAATLVGLSEAYSDRAGPDIVHELAPRIGADVPFCLAGGTALATGIGEHVASVERNCPLWFVIAKPPRDVSTAWAYALLDEAGTGEYEAEGDLLRGLARGDLELVARSLGNAFWEPVADELAELRPIRERLSAAGALGSMLTGSGSAVYGLFASAGAAERAALEVSSADVAFVAVAEAVERGVVREL
jgi:16S rRNA (adenine1518-N6/adenine1519-N6)-dimethyltransferase